MARRWIVVPTGDPRALCPDLPVTDPAVSVAAQATHVFRHLESHRLGEISFAGNCHEWHFGCVARSCDVTERETWERGKRLKPWSSRIQTQLVYVGIVSTLITLNHPQLWPLIVHTGQFRAPHPSAHRSRIAKARFSGATGRQGS